MNVIKFLCAPQIIKLILLLSRSVISVHYVSLASLFLNAVLVLLQGALRAHSYKNTLTSKHTNKSNTLL